MPDESTILAEFLARGDEELKRYLKTQRLNR